MKKCKNCDVVLPQRTVDSVGRKLGRVSPFCSKKCADEFFKKTHPDYFGDYYQNNKDKYKKESEEK